MSIQSAGKACIIAHFVGQRIPHTHCHWGGSILGFTITGIRARHSYGCKISQIFSSFILCRSRPTGTEGYRHLSSGSWVRYFSNTRTRSNHTTNNDEFKLNNTSSSDYFFPTHRRILLMRKVTRYEYEKHTFASDKEEELKNHLLAKGSDYSALVARHDEYHTVLDGLQEHLLKRGVDLKVVRRIDYDTELIDWADVVFAVGGDGTFLNAASKIKGHSKPLIGINSDPLRSFGYLCLPQQQSIRYKDSVDKVLDGKMRWKWRQRIRVTMSGTHTNEEPIDLNLQEVQFPEHRFWEYVKEHETYNNSGNVLTDRAPRILPVLALNEVFLGESLSARVSFYEMGLDGSERMKEKSSGLTVCTGTGSTSWFFNINHPHKQSVQEIVDIIFETCKLSEKNVDQHTLVDVILQKFNSSLRFDPSLEKMAYVVRDPVINRVFQVERPKGFCDRMSVKSRMWDGWVVVDGGLCFRFNDGAVAELEVQPEDALRCVELD